MKTHETREYQNLTRRLWELRKLYKSADAKTKDVLYKEYEEKMKIMNGMRSHSVCKYSHIDSERTPNLRIPKEKKEVKRVELKEWTLTPYALSLIRQKELEEELSD
jgi:hypothetical protein